MTGFIKIRRSIISGLFGGFSLNSVKIWMFWVFWVMRFYKVRLKRYMKMFFCIFRRLMQFLSSAAFVICLDICMCRYQYVGVGIFKSEPDYYRIFFIKSESRTAPLKLFPFYRLLKQIFPIDYPIPSSFH